MNWRAVGCGSVAAAAFVAAGVYGILNAGAPAECPDLLPYEPASYEPVGGATSEPRLHGIDDALVRAGDASFGLASWPVWVEPRRAPATSSEPLPQRIVLECGDGTFMAYQRGTE